MAMKMNTTAGDDGEKVMAADPLLDLARAIAAVDTHVNEYDRGVMAACKKEDGVAETYLRSAEQHAIDQYFSLKESLSCYEAKTMEGAMVQIAESYSLLDNLWDKLKEGEADPEAAKIKRAIERMLMSSLRIVERTAGHNLKSLGLGCFSNANLDPWEDVETRINTVKEMLP